MRPVTPPQAGLSRNDVTSSSGSGVRSEIGAAGDVTWRRIARPTCDRGPAPLGRRLPDHVRCCHA